MSKSNGRDAKATVSLDVLKEGDVVATLERTQTGCLIHPNTKSQVLRQNQGKLSYCLDLSQGTEEFRGINLPPYFAGLLPEGLRLKALVQAVKTSEDDLFSLLIAAGNDPVGDLYFPESSLNRPSDLYNQVPESFAEIQSHLKTTGDPSGVPLAGVQEKISADRLTLPIQLRTTNKMSYILKFGSQSYPHLVQNEFTCLNLARKCGLEVCQAKILVDEEGEEALLVKRFDRSWDKGRNSFLRFHQEDACQFLDRYPSEKYRLSIQEVTEGIVKFVEAPAIEILTLLKQFAFSYLIGNGDHHGKNVSLLREGAQASNRLSPAYDLVCTQVYGDDSMALKLDGKDKNWKRSLFIQFGKRHRIAAKAVESMLDQLLKKFSKHHEALLAMPMRPSKKRSLEIMVKTRMAHLT